MFLKMLQIKGFKSFADPAQLQLEPGVTVVVGPNGSGKSNVVDAIGWVLGAQAPSAVRSQKMDDVIFAGSSKRPALGRAEVSLTIDNTDRVLPIEFTEVTISRTLFRSGDSEYAINGVPCRLLDIQELLSDSGVGRQQHVIISQGQIDAVLNARPEDRRLIIEEAAGVLKYRRRKEKAERRLSSTEANLTRIQDLLREVRRQLRPLERQADAARRHGSVVAELSALKRHLAGRDIARLRTQIADSARKQADLRGEDRRIRQALAQLDAQVIATEAQLSAMGGPDFGDALVRYESLRERALGLEAVLHERARGLDRERTAFVDETVVASLESEHAQLTADLDALLADESGAAADDERLASAVAELAEARARFEAEWGDGVSAATGEAAEVRAEVAALRSAMERSQLDGKRLRTQLESLEARSRRLEAEATRATEAIGEATRAAEELDRLVPATAEAAERAAAARAAAEAAATEAAGERHRWEARAEALHSALDAARQQAGAERLAELDGVVGTLLDVIEVDDGWEAAVEAALAEALGAVVVSDLDTARTALAQLGTDGSAASLIVLGRVAAPGAPSTVGEPVRPHVRGVGRGVDEVLDSLLRHVGCAGDTWVEACDLAVAHPDATVVSRQGDRFSPAGWTVGLRTSGATGAALAEATEAATRSALVAEEAAAALDAARHEAEVASAAAAEARRDRDAAATRLESSTRALDRAERDRSECESELAAVRSHLDDLARRAEAETERMAGLEARLPALEAAEMERSEREQALAAARTALEEQAAAVGALRTDTEVRRTAIEERRRFLEDRIAAVDTRLERHAQERAAAGERRKELDARAEVVARLAEVVAARLVRIDEVLVGLRAARQRHSERTRAVTARLDDLRRQRAASEKELEVVRERVQRAELEDAETNIRLEGVTEMVRRELDCEPEAAMEAPLPELPEGTSPAARVRELERDLKLMGPINPLALEEFAALSERAELLESQLEDVRSARRELSKVIRAVDEEIVTVFTAAYADVSQNFSKLFETLFPGGTGGLTLTEPHDLLNTGIEIEARPSGKNVKKLSLLSGGERSLTALAYLFAVFRSRPSPFYVMDEVEAALDDVNLHRFLGLVAEFRTTAQLLIVSHQKRTMEAADVLYGVTMEPGGSSKVLSEKVGASSN